MASLVKQAHDNSTFLSLMDKHGFVDPFGNKIRANVQPVARQRIIYSPYETVEDSGVIRFKVPRYGVWTNAFLQYNFTYTPATNAECYTSESFAYAMFDRVELVSKDRVILTVHGEDFIDYVLQLKDSAGLGIVKGRGGFGFAGSFNDADGANYGGSHGYVEFILPIPFSIFVSKRQNLYVQFVEELEVVVHLRPRAIDRFYRDGSPVLVNEGHKLRLCSECIEPNEKVAQNLIAEMRAMKSGGTAIAKLQSSTYKERTDYVDSDGLGTSITIDISCPYPTFQTFFSFQAEEFFFGTTNGEGHHMIRPNETATDMAIVRSIQVFSAGHEILQFDQSGLIHHMSKHKKNVTAEAPVNTLAYDSGDTFGYSSQSEIFQYAICWDDLFSGLLGAHSQAQQAGKVVQAGCIPWRHLTNPQIKITLTRTTAQSTKILLHMAHQYHLMTLIDPDNGKIVPSTLE